MRGILLTREDHIAFLQKEAIHKHIYPKATKIIAIHLMSIRSSPRKRANVAWSKGLVRI
jgi:hypothetical protein